MPSRPRLHVLIASTRPGRVGPAVARWFHEFAARHGDFDAHLVDLADFALPVYDEPNHPRMQRYEHEHTKRWSASVDAADAFVIVTPEYNYNPPPALVNALNYLYNEWNYKPVGFVSYGGVSGGLRAVQSAKLLVTTLKMVPLVEGVSVPMVNAHLSGEGGAFVPNELHEASATALLGELRRWSDALTPMRQPNP